MASIIVDLLERDSSTEHGIRDAAQPPVDTGVANPLPSSVASGLLQTQPTGQYAHELPNASQLQQLYAANLLAFAPKVGTGKKIEALETKKRKLIESGTHADAVRVCTICNVICNSDKTFVSHLTGEKHALEATKKATEGLIPSATFSCDICEIDCNSVDVLNNHLLGRKHLKNLQKSQQSFIEPKAAIPTAAAATTTTNSAQNEQLQKQNAAAKSDEVLEVKKEKVLSGGAAAAGVKVCTFCNPAKPTAATTAKATTTSAQNEQLQKQIAAVKPEEVLEMKKQKVLSGGAAPAGVKVCTTCNVVCNSETVYSSHIAGKKHVATMKHIEMMKQHGAFVG